MSQTAAWLVLIVAGLFEIGWAVGLKYTDGFTRLWPTAWTAVALVSSMVLLGMAVRVLPLGTAYAVWVGIGAVGTAVLGIALLGEPATLARVASIGLVVAGIVGLKLATALTASTLRERFREAGLLAVHDVEIAAAAGAAREAMARELRVASSREKPRDVVERAQPAYASKSGTSVLMNRNCSSTGSASLSTSSSEPCVSMTSAS